MIVMFYNIILTIYNRILVKPALLLAGEKVLNLHPLMEAIMKCSSCGYENREDAPYCSMCQSSFNKIPVQSSEPVTASIFRTTSPASKTAAPETAAKTGRNATL